MRGSNRSRASSGSVIRLTPIAAELASWKRAALDTLASVAGQFKVNWVSSNAGPRSMARAGEGIAGVTSYLVFGSLAPETRRDLDAVLMEASGLVVGRTRKARSNTPFPNSTDLEAALVPLLGARGFEHLVRFHHPRSVGAFEYDFWRAADHVAMEIMGYRSDDEIYKDILKFHVHEATRVGVVWLPRWKWVSGRRTDTNFRAATKALAFAETYLSVDALVALVYDWETSGTDLVWRLTFTHA